MGKSKKGDPAQNYARLAKRQQNFIKSWKRKNTFPSYFSRTRNINSPIASSGDEPTNSSASSNYLPGSNLDKVIEDTIDENSADVPDNQNVEELQSLLHAVCKKYEHEIIQPRTWASRKQADANKWDEIFDTVCDVFVQRFNPLENVTCGCSEAARVLCHDCGNIYYCGTCDMNVHIRNGCHDRKHWSDGFLTYLPTQHYFIGNDLCFKESCIPILNDLNCVCSTPHWSMKPHKKCILITEKGRFDLYIPMFVCICGNTKNCSIELLLNSGFWPASPSVTAGSFIFSENLLESFDAMKNACPSLSRHAFIKQLEYISTSRNRAGNIGDYALRSVYSQWRSVKKKLGEMASDNWSLCPCCNVECHAVHIDGNKKLYRFRGYHQSHSEIRGNDSLWCDDDNVDSFVKKIHNMKLKSGSSICGDRHYSAARAASKTMKGLDETGLVMASCRHGVILRALNMYQGEIYAYPLKIIFDLIQNREIKFICQDVVCKFWPYVKRLLDSDVKGEFNCLNSLKPFLSVWHAKGHDYWCQLYYGGRMQLGAAAQSGEEMEQGNSYMSMCGKNSRTMDKLERKEHLTSHMLHYNERKIMKLNISVMKRFNKNEKNIEDWTNRFVEVVATFGIENTSDRAMLLLKQQVQSIAKARLKPLLIDDQLSDVENHYQLHQIVSKGEHLSRFLEDVDEGTALILRAQSLIKELERNQMSATKKRLKLKEVRARIGKISNIEEFLAEGKKKLAMRTAEELLKKIRTVNAIIKHKSVEIARYADSSKKRARMRLQITKENSKLSELIRQYNLIQKHAEGRVISIETIHEVDTDTTDALPFHSKVKVVETYEYLCRYKEERNVLIREMRSMITFLEENLSSISEKCLSSEIHVKPFYLHAANKMRLRLHAAASGYNMVLSKEEIESKGCDKNDNDEDDEDNDDSDVDDYDDDDDDDDYAYHLYGGDDDDGSDGIDEDND